MEALEFYRLSRPEKWAIGPKSFSQTSLNSIEQCPRQWQLMHSEYAGFGRYPARPSPASVEGNIVHEILDKLFKLLSIRGLPAVGSDEFRSCVMQFNVRESIQKLIDTHEEAIFRHPRSSGFRLNFSTQQLTNKSIRLFRQTYYQAFDRNRGHQEPPYAPKVCRAYLPKSLSGLLFRYKFLSELNLTHPSLNFVGILDLIQLDDDDIIIIDFKIGQKKPEHVTQLLYYAILWWRCSGVLPSRLEIRYPGELVEFKVLEHDLIDAERGLKKRIDNLELTLSVAPSKECLGSHCRYCDVRQFCDEYWCQDSASLVCRKGNSSENGEIVDLEVVVSGKISNFGFEATTLLNQKISITYEGNTGQIHGPFENGEQLRIVRGVLKNLPLNLEIKPWSEVFHFCSK